MDKHEMFMRKALEEARLAEEEGEIPVGAVVVCKGRVIARAHNQTERLNDVTAHAEMLAITSATSLLGGKYSGEMPEKLEEICQIHFLNRAWMTRQEPIRESILRFYRRFRMKDRKCGVFSPKTYRISSRTMQKCSVRERK